MLFRSSKQMILFTLNQWVTIIFMRIKKEILIERLNSDWVSNGLRIFSQKPKIKFVHFYMRTRNLGL